MTPNYIEIGGQKRPVKFGFNALTDFGEVTGKTIEQINTLSPNNLTMKELLVLCWCGLKAGARKENLEFASTVEDVGDWLDERPEAMIDMMKEYNKSREPDPTHPSVKKNPGKKQKP